MRSEPSGGPPPDIDRFIQEYEEKRPLYEEFTKELVDLLKRLLADARIRTHALESRTKEVTSFRDKITRSDKIYKDPLNEVPDLSGVRIIVYYAEDIDRVSSLIEKEFSVDPAASGDKAEQLEPYEFGYRSRHYVVSLPPRRRELSEWRFKKDFRAEIQVRTVLQHAWAAISHAFQYKHEDEIPRDLRRRLFRLSALLEVADDEFTSLRQKHEEFADSVATSLRRGIKEIDIDRVALAEYLLSSENVRKLVESAQAEGFVLEDAEPGRPDRYLSGLYRLCMDAKVDTIDELDDKLASALQIDGRFFYRLTAKMSSTWSVGPAFLVGLIVILMHNNCFAAEDLEKNGWAKDIAQMVLETAREIW